MAVQRMNDMQTALTSQATFDETQQSLLEERSYRAQLESTLANTTTP